MDHSPSHSPSSAPAPGSQPSHPGRTEPQRRRPAVRALRWLLLLLAIWAGVAYLLIPWIAGRYFRDHQATSSDPTITRTGDDHPGDPLNIALLATESQLVHAMTAAGWHPADPITFDTSVRIAVDSVVHRPDEDAPVSNLFLYGRKQDLAFEQPVGDSPAKRHHVRFWKSPKVDGGRPLWMGSATYDERVGLSHATGQVTHHIGPDVDAERNRIVSQLEKAGWAAGVAWQDGFHTTLEGRNGGDDRWVTDGRLATVELRERASTTSAPSSPAAP